MLLDIFETSIYILLTIIQKDYIVFSQLESILNRYFASISSITAFKEVQGIYLLTHMPNLSTCSYFV